jgi:clan AA aspartic protease (TIGR02281 family)
LLYPSLLLAEDIPLNKKGGVYEIPIEINGVITLNFVLDTGASEVNIPADVALTLYRAGTIKDADFLPGQTYRLADGSQVNSSRFVLRSLKMGQRRITNVAASIGNISSSLLLGQSFLEKLGAWGIDSQKQVLVLGATTPPSRVERNTDEREDRQGSKTKNYSITHPIVQTINPITEYIINNASYNKSTPEGNEWIFHLTFKNGKYSNGYIKWMGDINRDRVTSEIRNKSLGDLNGDNINDGVVIVDVNNGGSGTVNYLYALIGERGSPIITEPIYLGDRTEIKSLNIKSGTITLDIIKHKQGDASCCPTQQTTLVYWMNNGKIVGSKFKDY